MKIFLIASIHGKAQGLEAYQTLINEVTAQGHTMVADHILNNTPAGIAAWTEEQDLQFHKQIFEGIKKADAIFAEVSANSTSVGYLIAMAVQLGKPVIIFYNGDKEPHVFRSLEKTQEKVQIIRYKSLADLKNEITYVIEFVTSIQDTRFNFFISPEHSYYLDWIAKNRKIPRSVYLRQLIDENMDNQTEYSN